MLYKWLLVLILNATSGTTHPVFLSVTEIDHNMPDKTLEISCKVFTDDFEKALRKVYNARIDLIDQRLRPSMNVIVNDYLQKHLALKVNGKPVAYSFLGYEQQEEGVVSFFEVKNISAVSLIEVHNDILYDHEVQQIGIIHVTVGGNRKSSRLNNPEATASFTFP